MKKNNYWIERFKQIEENSHKIGKSYIKELEPIFFEAERELNRAIEHWIIRIADNNGISTEQAMKLLSTDELKEFKWDVEKYVSVGRKNKELNGLFSKQLENASAKHHITKLEALKTHTRAVIEKLASDENEVITNAVTDVFTNTYTQAINELLRDKGAFGGVNPQELKLLISKPWLKDGKNFSSRIWERSGEMVDSMHKTLITNLIEGKHPMTAINSLKEFVKSETSNAKHRAKVLLMTESAYFSSEACKTCYDDIGLKKYEIIATLDSRTSDICNDQHGKIYELKEWEVGETAPPFHPLCRTTTAPVVDGWEREEILKVRGNDGKLYGIISDTQHVDRNFDTQNEFISPLDFLVEKRYNLNSNSKVSNYSSLQKRYDYVDASTNVPNFIPKGAEITKVKILFKGSAIKDLPRLISYYGGKQEDWEKKAGQVNSAKYMFDMHWYEHSGVQYEMKHKIRKDKL